MKGLGREPNWRSPPWNGGRSLSRERLRQGAPPPRSRESQGARGAWCAISASSSGRWKVHETRLRVARYPLLHTSNPRPQTDPPRVQGDAGRRAELRDKRQVSLVDRATFDYTIGAIESSEESAGQRGEDGAGAESTFPALRRRPRRMLAGPILPPHPPSPPLPACMPSHSPNWRTSRREALRGSLRPRERAALHRPDFPRAPASH